MISKHASAMLMVWAVTVAGGAHAAPFLEVVGGTQETQGIVGLGNIIPVGAVGWENRQFVQGDPTSKNPITIYLRDTTAPDGTMHQIFADYVGHDSAFINEFSAGNGAIQWCNRATATGCSMGAAPAGNPGGLDWFGNYSATGSFTGTVGDAIDFTFFAELIGGSPQHVFGNGDSIFDAHMGVFNIDNDTFDFVNYNRTGMAFGLGLTDGEFSQTDDDHQDLMVRFSVVPEPGTVTLLASGLVILGATRKRVAA